MADREGEKEEEGVEEGVVGVVLECGGACWMTDS